MRIILLKDVLKVGHKYDVTDVADGYARNFLIAQGLAQRATERAIKETETRRNTRKEAREIHARSVREEIKNLDGEEILHYAKTNEVGGLFAGIGRNDVEKILKEKGFAHITSEHIRLEDPIKKAGVYQIEIEGEGEKGMCTLQIERATKE